MKNPKCFISYSWDSKSHKEWIRIFAENLTRDGVVVLLDQWDVRLGTDLPNYMETSVREADYVLLICTPTFAMKANVGQGGVGYEKTIVTGEIFHGSASQKKYIPVLREGDYKNSLPSYLKSKSFIDFRDDLSFSIIFEELLRHIYESPQFSRPPLGNIPEFVSKPLLKVESSAIPKKNNNIYCNRCGAVPGISSSCQPGYGGHNFLSSTTAGTLYCSRCGAVPGKSSNCQPGYGGHNFLGH